MTDICPECRLTVRKRQHGVTCDRCDRWHHRTCNTGISRAQYYSAIRGNLDLSFTCRNCRQTTESSHDSPADTSTDSTDVTTNGTKEVTYSSIYDELPPVSPTLVIDFSINDGSDDEGNFSGLNHNNANDRDGIFDVIHEAAADFTVIDDGWQEVPTMSDTVLEEVAKTYDNMEVGSKCQHHTLVSSDGQSYCVKVTT